jgi:lauroyl/myristoyl acyltransferase
MSSRNPVASFLAYLPQAALLGIARLLPYRARLAYAAGFTRLLVAALPGMRARVEGNLRLIFPEMPAAERRRIRAGMADSFGRTMIEVMTRRAFQARRGWTGPDGPGWAALREAQAAGRGALLVSGHFGQWEAVRAALAAQGIESGALIRPVKNPWLNRDYLACVEAGGLPVVGRDRAGLRDLVRHLRGGGVMAILAISMMFDAGQVVLGQSNRALGDSWGTTLCFFLAFFCVMLPLALVLAFATPLAEAGLFIGTAVGCATAVALLGFRFLRLVARV